jgi:AbrB family looped-hinge helix DNA binding protein
MRFVKKVNDRGVLTLPTEVREALGVEEGDIVEFEVLGVIKKGTQRPTHPRTAAESESPAPGGTA